MIIYSAYLPILSDDFRPEEMFSRCENGIPVFYEKDAFGKNMLKFSTDPGKYLEMEDPLH